MRQFTRADLTDFVTLEAAAAATGKTTHNIRDYIQRGRIAKFDPAGERITRAANGALRVSLKEVRAFLSLVEKREERHHHAGLHPELGFYDVPERERTKHVHRLHPYLGKFIPQLVEALLARYVPRGRVLDPFAGSGTTLVQALESGLDACGADVAAFNCLLMRVKTAEYNPFVLESELRDAGARLEAFDGERPEGPVPRYVRDWFAPRAAAELLFFRGLVADYEHADVLRV